MHAMQTETRRPWWIPERETRDELIDSFDQSDDDLLQTFKDIQTFNRLFGGTSVVIKHIAAELRDLQGSKSLLDVATGLGDIPRELIKWSRKHQIDLSITGLDANTKLLRMAREMPDDKLQFIAGDARKLPFEDNTFDIVTCSLALHHFDEEQAAVILREMARVAKQFIILNDLRRAYLPAWLIWAISRMLRMNRLAKNDAYLSVLKSRTIDEYKHLSQTAGLDGAKVYKHPFWRAAIIWRKA